MSFNMDDYVDVAERIRMAKEIWPEMCLQPADPLKPYDFVEINGLHFVIYVAALFRTPDDPTPPMGVAWEQIPGTTPFTRGSELMNAETSAWGRAIIASGIPSKKIASKEEVRNRTPTVAIVRDIEPATTWESHPSGAFDPKTAPNGSPVCKHGARQEKKGNKNGRDYLGYTCPQDECPAEWWVFGADGQFHPPKAK